MLSFHHFFLDQENGYATGYVTAYATDSRIKILSHQVNDHDIRAFAAWKDLQSGVSFGTCFSAHHSILG